MRREKAPGWLDAAGVRPRPTIIEGQYALGITNTGVESKGQAMTRKVNKKRWAECGNCVPLWPKKKDIVRNSDSIRGESAAPEADRADMCAFARNHSQSHQVVSLREHNGLVFSSPIVVSAYFGAMIKTLFREKTVKVYKF